MKELLGRISRRRVLIFFGVGAAATATLFLGRPRARLPASGAGKRDLSQKERLAVLATATTFMGILFGRTLTSEDQVELLDRLNFTIAQDPTRLQDYAELKLYLDYTARRQGATAFVLSTTATQSELLDRLMSIRFRWWQVLLSREFGGQSARFQRIVTVIVPGLAWLYANSGVPWRARGYDRWPGIPGDWRDVLRPGNPIP